MRAVAGVGTATLIFISGVGTASADSTDARSVDHTFTTNEGQSVTCTVHGESTLFGTSSDARRRAQSSTSAYGSSQACAPGYASVLVTYTSSSGTSEHGSSGAFTDGVTWSGDDVSGGSPGFSGRHIYRFSDCRSDCTVELGTAPK